MSREVATRSFVDTQTDEHYYLVAKRSRKGVWPLTKGVYSVSLHEPAIDRFDGCKPYAGEFKGTVITARKFRTSGIALREAVKILDGK